MVLFTMTGTTGGGGDDGLGVVVASTLLVVVVETVLRAVVVADVLATDVVSTAAFHTYAHKKKVSHTDRTSESQRHARLVDATHHRMPLKTPEQTDSPFHLNNPPQIFQCSFVGPPAHKRKGHANRTLHTHISLEE